MLQVVVFDLETVPDLDAARLLLGLPKDTPSQEVRQALGAHYAKPDQSPADAFIKAPLHRIACIGALYAERSEPAMPWTITRCGVGHIGQFSERQLISRFLGSLSGARGPQLVGFNSSGFDLPVLRYRAFALGVPADVIHKANGRDYWYRYGKDHLDLCDVMSGFRASTPPSLAELAALCSVPVKIDGMDGSQVEPLVQAGRVDEVATYCETDVLATYMVFLRYALTVGELSRDAYDLSLTSLRDFLSSRLEKRPHVAPFVEALSVQDTEPVSEADVVANAPPVVDDLA